MRSDAVRAVLFLDTNMNWRFRIVDIGNNETIAQSEAYSRKIDAHSTAALICLEENISEQELTFGEQIKGENVGKQV